MMTLREWQATERPDDDLVCAASTVYAVDGKNSFSIGLSPAMWQVPDTVICKAPGGDRPNLLFTCISFTDVRRRPAGFNRKVCAETLERQGFSASPPNMPPLAYWTALQTSKFVASPEGNGVDCHRTYEALIAGAVPIVEDNPHTRQVYGDAPILWTRDYTEVTPEFLEAKYAEMLDTTYDFSRLFMSRLTREEELTVHFRTGCWREFSRDGTTDPNSSRARFVARMAKNSARKPPK